jgi:Ca2+-binding RTX toxin-like protein
VSNLGNLAPVESSFELSTAMLRHLLYQQGAYMANIYFTDQSETIALELGSDLEGTIYLAGGDDTLKLRSGGGDMRSGTVHGGLGDDTITGYNIQAIYGDEGNDNLNGRGEVYGGAGNDVLNSLDEGAILNGGDGDDVLTGTTASEYFIGGAGKDIMTGGAGYDSFIFGLGDLGLGYASRDEIVDFEVGIDHIDLSAFGDADITYVSGDTYSRIKIDVDHDHRTDYMIQVTYINSYYGDDLLV